MPSFDLSWVTPEALAEVASPAIVLGLEPIAFNLRRMLEITGGPERLRPHVKTHKLPQLIQQQLAAGITKFKCATIAESEMCAQAGAPDVLLAYQLVGPNIARWIRLVQKYSGTHFASAIDSLDAAEALSTAAAKANLKLDVWLDLNVGQNRTGIAPGAAALKLYLATAKLPGLQAKGLHAYDGHLQIENVAERTAACDAAIAPVFKLRDDIRAAGLPEPVIVAGGSPTFAIHAARKNVECSPGTTVLWDASYAIILSEQGFKNAAVLLTRVVSKPAPDRVCLDLGHKAIGSEMPHPRVFFPAIPDAEGVTHSEEHLVIKTAQAADIKMGDAFLGVPWHVCPSLALHAQAVLVDDNKVTGTWPIVARARALTV